MAKELTLAHFTKTKEEKHCEGLRCLPLAAAVWPVPPGPSRAARGVLSDTRSEGYCGLVRVPRGAPQGEFAPPLSWRPPLFEALKRHAELAIALLKARA